MILARKANLVLENKSIINLLRENNLENEIKDDSISYILEDNENIIGCSNFRFVSDYAMINFLVIDRSRRGENLGDGLLRAVLNYCLRSGIKKAVYVGNSKYFLKKGFTKSEDYDEKLSLITTRDKTDILICDIDAFFDRGCGFCKRS